MTEERSLSPLDEVKNYKGRPLRIMEVCGTHTHEIFRLGIRQVLPDNVKLISGPGCPVCVTPNGFIDEAIFLAQKGCIICTFGDLVRVPGSASSLAKERAKGADVRTVYTPKDAAKIAEETPDRQVVFLSVGFETTVPSSCIAVKYARQKGLANFSLLTANKTMTNAYRLLKDSADAYLYPGHVCAITGTGVLDELAEKEGISGAVCGFTAEEILSAIAVIMKKCGGTDSIRHNAIAAEGARHNAGAEPDRAFAVNCYPRVVRPEGSPAAKVLIDRYMEPCDAIWRGIGLIPLSGLRLRPEYALFDARAKFSVPHMDGHENPACRCGQILRGNLTPHDCPLFGKVCTPDNPVGSCMVSSEGTCSAYYKYGRPRGDS